MCLHLVIHLNFSLLFSEQSYSVMVYELCMLFALCLYFYFIFTVGDFLKLCSSLSSLKIVFHVIQLHKTLSLIWIYAWLVFMSVVKGWQNCDFGFTSLARYNSLAQEGRLRLRLTLLLQFSEWANVRFCYPVNRLFGTTVHCTSFGQGVFTRALITLLDEYVAKFSSEASYVKPNEPCCFLNVLPLLKANHTSTKTVLKFTG